MKILEAAVLEHGVVQADKVAIATKEGCTTYGQLREKILGVLFQLQKRGVDKSQVVLLQATPDVNYIATYLALHCLGAIVVPVDRKAVLETLIEIEKQLHASFYIGSVEKVEVLKNGISYAELVAEEELAIYETEDYSGEEEYDILYTTGTTGKSKGVVSTRKSISAAMANEIEGPAMTSDDVLLIPIPLNHSFGIGKLRAILYLGGTVVLQNGVSMAIELKNNISRYHCTAMICVPSALQIICKQAGAKLPQVFEGIRFIEVASAPFSVELKEKLMEYLPHVHILNRYGSTETPAAIYLDVKEAPDKMASIGRALSHVQVKIIDDNLNEINSSITNTGKLAISGDMLMKEYYNDVDATEEIKRDGWIYSKDIAYIDEDGYIFLLGRDDDVINTGGKKVSPLELEDALLKSSLVKECAIIGIDDPMKLLGKVPVLAYVPENKGIKDEDVLNYLKNNFEKYKVPVACLRVKALPRNYMGKLERKNILEWFKS